ncbi:hypothetical protein K435DRAFT_851075 [Dendrothele bispora CBS 962.96]|uniref:Uncharacterized protein n=1 Tax=Dendrothele bispora (strain CBS 962.96) TaxID=1314807 RepID=A0A4S8MMU6_DENBC|nr:hypothetical protein K435DRAFT_851075 [Dendrothele bispora CBS 962.96]
MFSFKSFIIVATTAVALVSGTPTVENRAEHGLVSRQDNCQNFIGNCFQNGCAGTFANPGDTIGTCTAGMFNGCPCEKCGSGTGFTGGCGENGCNGVQGTCTAGTFQGCPCN